MSGALFSTVRAALAFAYSVASFTTHQAAFAGGAELAGMSAPERFAQGSLIRKQLEVRMSPLLMAMAFADHGANDFRTAGVREVCWQAGAVLRNRTLGVELAKRQFSIGNSRRSHEDLAAEFGVPMGTLARLDGLVCAELDRVRSLTERELQTAFIDAGIAASL